MTDGGSINRTPRLAYTVQQAAEALGISTDLVYDLCSRGELLSFKAGRRRLIQADSLEQWAGRRAESADWIDGKSTDSV